MHTKYHTLLGIALATITYITTKNTPATIATFIISWAPDTDHIIDYIIHEKTLKPNPTKLLTGQHYQDHKTIYIPLHAYEHTPLIYIITQTLLGTTTATTTTLAYLLHLITDTITNPIHPQTMLITWRAHKKFKSEHLCKNYQTTTINQK